MQVTLTPPKTDPSEAARRFRAKKANQVTALKARTRDLHQDAAALTAQLSAAEAQARQLEEYERALLFRNQVLRREIEAVACMPGPNVI